MFTIFLVIAALALFAKAAEYPSWKQYDNRWGWKGLGNNGTMSAWGCKITAIAMLMCHSDAENDYDGFNPGVLRDRYESRGFITHASDVASDGNLLDSAVSRANSPRFYKAGVADFNPYAFSYIYNKTRELLSQGYYVEVRVKFNGHSVAVRSASGGEIYIMDPGYNVTTLSAYDGGIYCGIYYARG